MIIRTVGKRSLKLTADGTEFATVSGPEHTENKIEARLNLWLGEWFADLRIGMPYHRDLLGKKTPEPVIRSMFWTALENCPGVAVVEKLNVTFTAKTRNLLVSYEVRLLDGSHISAKPFIIQAG